MRCTIAFIALFSSFSTSAQETAAVTHTVPFATAGNAIELVVTAPAAVAAASVEIHLVEAPKWVAVHPTSVELNAFEYGEDALARFSFDLLPSAPVAEPAALRFEVRGADGALLAEHTVRIQAEAPERFRLVGAYPNPFRTTARVAYELPTASTVTFSAFDVLGRRVLHEHSEEEAGRREQRLDGSRLAPGLYLWQLVADGPGGREVERGKLTLAR